MVVRQVRKERLEVMGLHEQGPRPRCGGRRGRIHRRSRHRTRSRAKSVSGSRIHAERSMTNEALKARSRLLARGTRLVLIREKRSAFIGIGAQGEETDGGPVAGEDEEEYQRKAKPPMERRKREFSRPHTLAAIDYACCGVGWAEFSNLRVSPRAPR